ncbi:MAG: ATP-binding cassette domain-containing protein [Alphaproteobacteria bacterium]|nr:ATP-binding cassette domain-containing protein [Alphaproteobacteria bacterium]
MIEVDQLTKVYGATKAIDGLSFTVGKGEIVGFLGPNGAGKSTTMRILAGALGATSGRALVGGIDVLENPRAVKELVGYLPERPPLYTEMTVRAYLRFAARIKSANDPAGRVEKVIEQVGLEPVAHRLIEHLSKGYRQRVGIAQALVHEPKVLILDEPASGLDPAQRVQIRSLVRGLAEGDTTVILSTHVLPEVEAICDRVVIIDQGQIKLQGDVHDLEGTGQAVSLVVARFEDALRQTLAAIEGVQKVTETGKGRLHVSSDRDIREEVARVAVPFGLLELRSQHQLEDVFIRLTKEDA